MFSQKHMKVLFGAMIALLVVFLVTAAVFTWGEEKLTFVHKLKKRISLQKAISDDYYSESNFLFLSHEFKRNKKEKQKIINSYLDNEDKKFLQDFKPLENPSK